MGDLNLSPLHLQWPATAPAWEGLMETLLLVPQVLVGRGCLTVILMEYWISRGQRSCLHSKFSISLKSRQTGDIWQYRSRGRRKGKPDLTRHHINFHSFSVAVIQPPLLPPSLTASPLHFTNTQRQVELAVWQWPNLSPANYLVCHKISHTPKLTLILAFKLSNHCGMGDHNISRHTFFSLWGFSWLWEKYNNQ